LKRTNDKMEKNQNKGSNCTSTRYLVLTLEQLTWQFRGETMLLFKQTLL